MLIGFLWTSRGISQVTLVRENHEPQNVVVPEPVDRRFRDFVWLEESLHDDVPGAILPVLPDKDFPVAAQNKGFLEARATACTVFLTTIISNPEVCDSDVARTRVHMFLSGNAAELDRLKQRTKALAKDQAAEAPAEEAPAESADAPTEEDSAPKISSWGSSMMAAATAMSRKAGSAAARLKAAAASAKAEKSEDELFVEKLMVAAKQKAAAMERVESNTRALLVCVEKMGNATNACGAATKAAAVATGHRPTAAKGGADAGEEVNAEDAPAAAGVEFTDAPLDVDCSLVALDALADHQVNVQTAALRGLLQRQIVGLFDPLRAHMLVTRGVGRALSTLQSRGKALRRLKTALEAKKSQLQKAYDNPKTPEERRRELEREADAAQSKVDDFTASLRVAMDRFRKEYDRFQAEKIETLQEIMLVWSKLHKVRMEYLYDSTLFLPMVSLRYIPILLLCRCKSWRLARNGLVSMKILQVENLPRAIPNWPPLLRELLEEETTPKVRAPYLLPHKICLPTTNIRPGVHLRLPATILMTRSRFRSAGLFFGLWVYVEGLWSSRPYGYGLWRQKEKRIKRVQHTGHLSFITSQYLITVHKKGAQKNP